jgi:hypothetical protein
MEAVGGAGGVPPWFSGEEAAGRARAILHCLVRSNRLGGHAGAICQGAIWTSHIWENGFSKENKNTRKCEQRLKLLSLKVLDCFMTAKIGGTNPIFKGGKSQEKKIESKIVLVSLYYWTIFLPLLPSFIVVNCIPFSPPFVPSQC